jgi:arylsulfatase I/J
MGRLKDVGAEATTMARAAVCAAALAALCGVHCVTAAESPSRPHVIFILADDLGYGIPGWGAAPTSPMQTPAIKALMDEGLTLTRQYAYMSCSPSRGSLLTGRYPYKLPQTRTNFLPAT